MTAPAIRWFGRAERRRGVGRAVRLISRSEAGHRPRFPGEGPASASPRFLYGGDAVADAELGAAAWPHVLDLLHG
ncbi:hypothetical protein [Nonomuraea pusilla]|uniref:hypothetical protein n=1 Tax=Nonomuraea pusilla TaxID=46177 RepID=UPI0006E15389|nr:hypothetical protein [Nonomuraea pusilla]